MMLSGKEVQMLYNFSLVVGTIGEEQHCNKDDTLCREKDDTLIDEVAYTAYKHKKVTSRRDFRY